MNEHGELSGTVKFDRDQDKKTKVKKFSKLTVQSFQDSTLISASDFLNDGGEPSFNWASLPF